MKRMMIFGFAVMMAIVLSIPAVYAQQDTKAAQDTNWRCPRMTQSADGKWICPATQSGTPGGGYGRMRGQRGMRGGMRGQCWRNNTQAQPPAQAPVQQ
ncbi:MAG: hypothetical protein AB9866_11975 [Syntrophobacteraceae bacterium]